MGSPGHTDDTQQLSGKEQHGKRRTLSGDIETGPGRQDRLPPMFRNRPRVRHLTQGHRRHLHRQEHQDSRLPTRLFQITTTRQHRQAQITLIIDHRFRAVAAPNAPSPAPLLVDQHADHRACHSSSTRSKPARSPLRSSSNAPESRKPVRISARRAWSSGCCCFTCARRLAKASNRST